MKYNKSIHIGEFIISIWVIYIFLYSLPYKFTNSKETQFIFGTIGRWLEGFFGEFIGKGFALYGGYIIGILELVVSIILFMATYFIVRQKNDTASLFFGIGGLGAMLLMIGATFFHLVSPLGIAVNGDEGSLFRAAVSIVFIGGGLFLYNFQTLKNKFL